MILLGGLGVGGPLVTAGLGYGFGLDSGATKAHGAGAIRFRRAREEHDELIIADYLRRLEEAGREEARRVATARSARIARAPRYKAKARADLAEHARGVASALVAGTPDQLRRIATSELVDDDTRSKARSEFIRRYWALATAIVMTEQ